MFKTGNSNNILKESNKVRNFFMCVVDLSCYIASYVGFDFSSHVVLLVLQIFQITN